MDGSGEEGRHRRKTRLTLTLLDVAALSGGVADAEGGVVDLGGGGGGEDEGGEDGDLHD